MEAKTIMITEPDYMRLQRLIDSSKRFRQRDAEHINALEEELERAIVINPGELAHNVVTMNSRVSVKDLNDGLELTYEIVFPCDADVAKNRISVLAPIGTGLLGYSAGTTVEWPVPSGVRRMRIVAVEAASAAA